MTLREKMIELLEESGVKGLAAEGLMDKIIKDDRLQSLRVVGNLGIEFFTLSILAAYWLGVREVAEEYGVVFPEQRSRFDGKIKGKQ